MKDETSELRHETTKIGDRAKTNSRASIMALGKNSNRRVTFHFFFFSHTRTGDGGGISTHFLSISSSFAGFCFLSFRYVCRWYLEFPNRGDAFSSQKFCRGRVFLLFRLTDSNVVVSIWQCGVLLSAPRSFRFPLKSQSCTCVPSFLWLFQIANKHIFLAFDRGFSVSFEFGNFLPCFRPWLASTYPNKHWNSWWNYYMRMVVIYCE